MWLPPDDGSDAGARRLVGGNAFEEAAQFDSCCQLAALLVGGMDRGGLGFGDHEHGWIVGAVVLGDKVVRDTASKLP
jgi:hypothetical protein